MVTPNKQEQEASTEEKKEEQKAPSPIQRVVGSLKGTATCR